MKKSTITLLIIGIIVAIVLYSGWTFFIRTPFFKVEIPNKTTELVKTVDQLEVSFTNKVADDLINSRSSYLSHQNDYDYIREITSRSQISDEIIKMMIRDALNKSDIKKEEILSVKTKWSSVSGWDPVPQSFTLILEDGRQIHPFISEGNWFWY